MSCKEHCAYFSGHRIMPVHNTYRPLDCLCKHCPGFGPNVRKMYILFFQHYLTTFVFTELNVFVIGAMLFFIFANCDCICLSLK